MHLNRIFSNATYFTDLRQKLYSSWPVTRLSKFPEKVFPDCLIYYDSGFFPYKSRFHRQRGYVKTAVEA